MPMKEELKELFKGYVEPELDNKARVHRYESIRHLTRFSKIRSFKLLWIYLMTARRSLTSS